VFEHYLSGLIELAHVFAPIRRHATGPPLRVRLATDVEHRGRLTRGQLPDTLDPSERITRQVTFQKLDEHSGRFGICGKQALDRLGGVIVDLVGESLRDRYG
jgi:hypothetical protein